jgi:hypothetical protein
MRWWKDAPAPRSQIHPQFEYGVGFVELAAHALRFIFHHEVKTTGFSRLALAALFFKLSFMR